MTVLVDLHSLQHDYSLSFLENFLYVFNIC